ncbi:hypothetical protein GLW08_16515 [Pontibacillus yanchengensis]|uniref:Uncharacterized protein n=1 Tax=Pontibacillus yanchengensis TaxID=462910 RepID=A0ACC7VLR2_9BACI|nr:CBO0543 family protein [Pontibacillus yanchengensis]MYL54939.1 hypothetical protein [Pontibacillus yanchengensis]
MKQHPTWEDIINLREKLIEQYNVYWFNNNLFHFSWWAIIILNIISIFVLWKLIDKKRLFELLTLGGITVYMGVIIDTITTNYVLTGYPTSLLPIFPSFFVSTNFILPSVYILIYQHFSSWKKYLIATIIFGVVGVLFEGFYRWMEVYEYINWNIFYSFITYVLLGIILKLIMNFFKKQQV